MSTPCIRLGFRICGFRGLGSMGSPSMGTPSIGLGFKSLGCRAGVSWIAGLPLLPKFPLNWVV